jgi:hypothetical protein
VTKITKKCFQEVHDPFLFSAPPFTGPCRHASLIDGPSDRSTRPQHSRFALLRCAVWAYWFNDVFSRMAMHVPVHGMQGVLKSKQKRMP